MQRRLIETPNLLQLESMSVTVSTANFSDDGEEIYNLVNESYKVRLSHCIQIR